jgi:glycosyltransferase involved in cell wall biosynthesis
LREEGLRGSVSVLPGEYEGSLEVRRSSADVEPVVVFAGRHIPEKRVLSIPPAVARARQRLPSLRAVVFGDGPDRAALAAAVAALGLDDVVAVPGFVSSDVVDEAMGHALCLLLPSRREGYGLVVIEAAARGTPSIVVAAVDNAAVELVCDGVNGFVARSDSAADLAEAILRVHAGGAALRDSTAAWFTGNARRLSLEYSLELVLESYAHRARV